MKRKLIILPVAATMIVVGIFTAGAVMAQGNDTNGTDTTPAVQSFASRVATILGLDETTVQNAMDQAHKDMQDEAMQNRLDALKTKLDAMVANGQITQEQEDTYLQKANEYYQWYLTRPQGIQGFGGPGMGFGFEDHGYGLKGEGPGFGFGRHGRGHGMWEPEGMFGAPQGTAPSQSPSQSDSGSNNGTAF
jgi:hypothetical protein